MADRDDAAAFLQSVKEWRDNTGSMPQGEDLRNLAVQFYRRKGGELGDLAGQYVSEQRAGYSQQPSPDDLREDINPVAGALGSIATGLESSLALGGDVLIHGPTRLAKEYVERFPAGAENMGRDLSAVADFFSNPVTDAVAGAIPTPESLDKSRGMADQYAQEHLWAGRLPRAAGSLGGLVVNLALLKKVPGLRGHGAVPGALAFGTEQALVPEIQAEARGQESRPAHFIPIGQEEDSSRLERMGGRFAEGATLDLALRGLGKAGESLMGKVPILGASQRVNAAAGQGAALAGLGAAQAPEGQRGEEALVMGLLGAGMGAAGGRFPPRGEGPRVEPGVRGRGPLGQGPMNQARKPTIDPNARRQVNPDLTGSPIGPAGREMMARDRMMARGRQLLEESRAITGEPTTGQPATSGPRGLLSDGSEPGYSGLYRDGGIEALTSDFMRSRRTEPSSDPIMEDVAPSVATGPRQASGLGGGGGRPGRHRDYLLSRLRDGDVDAALELAAHAEARGRQDQANAFLDQAAAMERAASKRAADLAQAEAREAYLARPTAKREADLSRRIKESLDLAGRQEAMGDRQGASRHLRIATNLEAQLRATRGQATQAKPRGGIAKRSGDPMWDAMVKGDRPAYLLPGEGNRALMSPAERRLALPPPEMLAKAGIQPVKVPGMGTLYVKKSHPMFAGQDNIPEFIRAMRLQGREHELMGYTPEAKLDEATHIVTAVGKDGKEIVSVGTKDPVQEASNLENVEGVAETVVRPASPETVAEINAGRLTEIDYSGRPDPEDAVKKLFQKGKLYRSGQTIHDFTGKRRGWLEDVAIGHDGFILEASKSGVRPEEWGTITAAGYKGHRGKPPVERIIYDETYWENGNRDDLDAIRREYPDAEVVDPYGNLLYEPINKTKPESSLRQTKDKTLTSIREKGAAQHIQDRLRELGDESVPTDPNAPRQMASPPRRRPTPARTEEVVDPNAPRAMRTPPRRPPTPAREPTAPTGERFGQVEIDALKDQGATVKPLKSRPGYDVTMPDGTGALIHTDSAGNVTKVTNYGKGKAQRPKRSKRERGMIDPNAFIDTINKGTDYAIDFFKRLERGVDNLSPFEIRAMLARLPEVRDKAYDHMPDTHWFVSAPEGEVWPRVASRLTETYDYKAVKAPEVFGSNDTGRTLRDDLAKNAAEEAGGELVAIHDVKSHRDNLTLAITEELDISTGEKYYRVVSIGGKRGEPGVDVNGTMEDFPSLREAREAAKNLDLQRREDLADDIEFSTKGGVNENFREDFISDDPKVRRSPRERGMVDPRGVVEAGAKAADIAEKAARDFLRRAKTEIMDPAESWRADQKAKAKARGKAAEIMAAVGEATGARSTARWLSRKLGLPPSDPIVRNLNDSAQVFRDDVQARINQLHEKSSRLQKDQEREFWYRAEKLEEVPKDHPLHDLLREHHEIVTSEADLLVRAGEEWTSTARMLRERANEKPKGSKERAALLRQAAQLDSAARLSRSRAEFYNQPGERGYVTRVPPRNKAKVKEAAKAFVSRLIRNLRTPGLRGMAASVDKSIKDTLKGRKQLTPEEADAAGYAVGLVPLMRSWHKAGGVVSTFHTMEYVNTAKEFAPYVRLPEGPKDKSGQWILADGPGWGVLRGKEIHHSLYGMLEVMTPKGRNGIMDLLRAFDAGQKEGATVQRLPGYPVKAAILENPVATWAAGMSPIRFKRQLGDAIPSTFRFLKTGEQDQYMKVIVDAGLAHNSAAMVEVRDTAGSGSDAASTNLRIGSGKGREYLAEFRERFLSHLAERIAAIPEGTQFSLGSKGAELINTVREAWVNFDYARFAGIDASLKPGVLAREAAGIVDLVWKRALVAELMQTGGGGDLVRTAVRAATGAKPSGLTAIETRTVLRDWFDPSRMAEGVRDVSNFPLAGDFIRFAYMHGRNVAPSSLGGGGYWKRNPLGTAVAIAPAAVITSGFIAYLMSQGMSQEEAEAVVEEGKKQMTGGDEERMQSIAPVMLTEDKDGNPVLYGVPIEQALGIRSFLRSPAKNVVGNPEEGYMGRLLRGVLSTSPTGQVLYESLADRDIYTGGSIRPGDDNTNMLEMMKGSGLPVATVQQWSRRAAKRKRAEELGLDPDVYAGTTGETLFRSLMGVGLKAGHDPKSPAGREQMGFRKFLERQERLLDASKEGGRFSPEMRRPEPIRPDDSEAERARKQRLWQTYFRENPHLLRQMLGQ